MYAPVAAVDHSVLVAQDEAVVPSSVKVTGKVWKQNRFGQSYQHTQVQWLEEGSDFTGKKVSASQGEIKLQYKCSCGKVAFHKGWNS